MSLLGLYLLLLSLYTILDVFVKSFVKSYEYTQSYGKILKYINDFSFFLGNLSESYVLSNIVVAVAQYSFGDI
jgi:hypothetical protein